MNSCCSELPVAGTAHIRLPTNTYNWLLLDGPIFVMAHLNPSLILLLQRASSYHCPSLLRCLMTNSIFFFFSFFFSKSSCTQCFSPSGCSHKAFFERTHARQHHRCIIISPRQPSYSMGLCHQQHVWYILDAPQQEKHNMKHKELTRKRHPCMNRHASTSSEGATLETTLT